jgi:hypothetical protein
MNTLLDPLTQRRPLRIVAAVTKLPRRLLALLQSGRVFFALPGVTQSLHPGLSPLTPSAYLAYPTSGVVLPHCSQLTAYRLPLTAYRSLPTNHPITNHFSLITSVASTPRAARFPLQIRGFGRSVESQ